MFEEKMEKLFHIEVRSCHVFCRHVLSIIWNHMPNKQNIACINLLLRISQGDYYKEQVVKMTRKE